MRTLKVIWIGGLGSTQCVGEEMLEVIDSLTSEHDSEVKVLIILENTTQFLGKQPLLYQNEIYLAIFFQDCILIFEENSLNISELIFIYDNVIAETDDAFVDVSVCDYFYM